MCVLLQTRLLCFFFNIVGVLILWLTEQPEIEIDFLFLVN